MLPVAVALAALAGWWWGRGEDRLAGRAANRPAPPPVWSAAAVVRLTTYAEPTTGGEQMQIAFGSGFFVAPDGLLLTAMHVLDGAATVRAAGADGLAAWIVQSVVAWDAGTDLALLRVQGNPSPPGLPLGPAADLHTGVELLALGYPVDGTEALARRPARLAGRRLVDGSGAWLRLAADLPPGMSGGPLVEPQTGQVVGIVALADQQDGNGGFAAPSEAAVALRQAIGQQPELSLEAWQRRQRQRQAWQAFAADHRLDRAKAQLAAGNAAAARLGLLALLAADGADNPLIMQWAAKASERMGRLEEAEQLLAQAAALADEAAAWLEVASLGRRHQRLTVDQQCLALHRAVVANPGHALAWQTLGLTLAEAGRHPAAAAALAQAAALRADLSSPPE